MEYLFIIIIQTLYMFLCLTSGNRGGYLIHNHKLYKMNKIICFVINILAVLIDFIFYRNNQIKFIVLIISIIVSSLILIILDGYSKKGYYKKLKERILLISDISTMTTHDIKVYFIKRYGEVYSILDIEKIIKKLEFKNQN